MPVLSNDKVVFSWYGGASSGSDYKIYFRIADKNLNFDAVQQIANENETNPSNPKGIAGITSGEFTLYWQPSSTF